MRVQPTIRLTSSTHHQSLDAHPALARRPSVPSVHVAYSIAQGGGIKRTVAFLGNPFALGKL